MPYSPSFSFTHFAFNTLINTLFYSTLRNFLLKFGLCADTLLQFFTLNDQYEQMLLISITQHYSNGQISRHFTPFSPLKSLLNTSKCTIMRILSIYEWSIPYREGYSIHSYILRGLANNNCLYI